MRARRTAIGVALLAIAVVIWRCHDSRGPGPGTPIVPHRTVTAHVDPHTLPRGSIAGTIRDGRGAPIARAHVCASFESVDLSSDETHDPICTTTDEHGRYRLADLLAATYAVEATAARYIPATYLAGGQADATGFRLAPGEQRAGVDIVLGDGAVEVTGTVTDISGGPIGHARVSGESVGDHAYFTEADDHGAFSLWLAPSRTARFVASAEGYAPTVEHGQAPDTIELQLVPDSSIAGTVVDAATGAPREGVMVRAESLDYNGSIQIASARSDAGGQFRISRLLPSRFTFEARSDSGYGRAEGSVLVGLGQHVEGVTIKIHRAYRIAGSIVIAGTAQPCPDPWLAISRDAIGTLDGSTSQDDGGVVTLDGVVPGTYHVSVRCAGYYLLRGPPSVTVKDADVTGLVWEVAAGASIHGHVRTQHGGPIRDTTVFAHAIPRRRDSDGTPSARASETGEYTLAGLRAGTYRLELETPAGVPPAQAEIAVPADTVVEHDLVLADGGTIAGSVVDSRGTPVRRVEVQATRVTSSAGGDPDPATTARDGSFRIEGVAAGDYRVFASRGWASELRKPGTTDDDVQGERVHVEVGQIAAVKLVVDSETGVIRGTVADGDDTPIGDAWITAARESDAGGATGNAASTTYWNPDARPVLTAPDGTFELARLAPGTYTVRAFRKGGGDAIAEHVAVGSRTRLQIKPTASIEGVVKAQTGAPPDDFTVTLRSPTLGLTRTERLFRTGGRYAVRDLPAGSFEVDVEAHTGRGALAITLAIGEHKTGADIALDPLVTLTGTLVELGTHAPISEIRMFAQAQHGNVQLMSYDRAFTSNITDRSGRFTIEDAPVGEVVLIGTPLDLNNRWRVGVGRTISATASGSLELGDIAVVSPRVKTGDMVGTLGVRFTRGTDNAWLAERHEVAWIDPAGPAAKTALAIGDVVTTVDGIDVTGDNTGRFDPLIEAPPGTVVTLGIARATPIKITLAAP